MNIEQKLTERNEHKEILSLQNDNLQICLLWLWLLLMMALVMVNLYLTYDGE